MRLIDADELIKDIMSYKTMPEIRKAICEVIDNAPTVEIPKAIGTVDKNGDIKIELIRPHGKWTRIPCKYVIWQCSNCNNFSENWTSFCCWCGADMRGGDNHVAI